MNETVWVSSCISYSFGIAISLCINSKLDIDKVLAVLLKIGMTCAPQTSQSNFMQIINANVRTVMLTEHPFIRVGPANQRHHKAAITVDRPILQDIKDSNLDL